MRTIVDEQNSISQAPIQGIFLPSSYLVLIGGPKAPLPARVVRRSPPTPTQPSLFRERSWTSSTKENRKLSFSPSQWLMEREFGLSQRKESSSYTASLRYVKEGRKEIHICFFFSILCVCLCVCVVLFARLFLVFHGLFKTWAIFWFGEWFNSLKSTLAYQQVPFLANTSIVAIWELSPILQLMFLLGLAVFQNAFMYQAIIALRSTVRSKLWPWQWVVKGDWPQRVALRSKTLLNKHKEIIFPQFKNNLMETS